MSRWFPLAGFPFRGDVLYLAPAPFHGVALEQAARRHVQDIPRGTWTRSRELLAGSVRRNAAEVLDIM